MEKLDRLGWAAGIAFSCHGLRIGIRANVPEALPELEPFLPPYRRPTDSPVVDELYSLRVASPKPGSRVRPMNLVYSGIARLERAPDLSPVLEALEADLLLRVSEVAPRVFVRAGVVEWKGGGWLIVGPQGAGTSTLVRELVELGARYLSDRCAVLDKSGRVFPYGTPIKVPSGDAGAAAERLLVPKGRTYRRSVPVCGVLVTGYRSGARWRPERLSPGRGLLGLVPYALPARSRPQRTMKALQAVVQRAPIFHTARGEAGASAPRVLELFESEPRPDRIERP